MPNSLISHYSAFLKAACSHDFKEKEDNCIRLVDEEPKAFAAFVSFMYYGRYALTFGNVRRMHERIWLLGDKLMSVALKNYAMDQIHHRDMVVTLFTSTISPEDFALVCNNTVEGSKLRQFYLDFLASHFADKTRILGGLEEWDTVLGEHDDARVVMLKHMRSGNTFSSMRAKEYYMETQAKENGP